MEQSGRAVVFADLTGSTGLFESAGNVAATQVITRCTHALADHLKRGGGHVVKLLGDGVLTLFNDSGAAVDACMRTRDVLRDLKASDARIAPLGVKIGIEHGPIVDHGGDCYGDAVNVASRLSDRAQTNEILIGEGVYRRLPDALRLICHSLDRIVIKGKAEPLRVWRVDWARTAETTLTVPLELLESGGRIMMQQRLDLVLLDKHLELLPESGPLIIGRGEEAGFNVNDRRVSRRHARVEWTGGQCVLTDFSSNGTWVRFADSPSAVMLKRDSCMLHGHGEIGLGAAPDDFTAPTVSFRVIDES